MAHYGANSLKYGPISVKKALFSLKMAVFGPYSLVLCKFVLYYGALIEGPQAPLRAL